MTLEGFYHLVKTIVIIASLLSTLSVNANTSPDTVYDENRTRKISTIVIDGNKVTKAKIIKRYMGIDTGDVYDSSVIKTAEENLNASDLFSHVKIHTVVNPNKVIVLVIVREKQRYALSSIGGVIYNTKYGQKTERIWIQGYGAVTNNNFRGMSESLRLSASLWTIRYIGFSWTKPFITVPYYIKIGSTIGSSPYLTTPFHLKFYNSSSFTVGRKFGQSSKLYSSLHGTYKVHEWKGGDGELSIINEHIENLPSHPEMSPMIRDTSWIFMEIDTMGMNPDSFDTTYYLWDGFSDKKIKKYEEPYTEAFLSLGWATDKRDIKYHPHKGFYFSANIKTNALWPYKDIHGEKKRYLQLNNEFRFYHRGIWKKNVAAYRVRSSIKPYGKGNIYSGMYMGNEYTLRGYSTGAFGSYEYNHRLLFSTEYRFPIYQLPALRFPWLAWYDSSLNNFIIQIDGALILDCGYIWKDLKNLIHPRTDHKSAAGTGFGLRFMLPSLKRAICAEVVWPIYPKERASGWPALYLFLDLPF
jgi:outer membrane protein assembly factor BamA